MNNRRAQEEELEQLKKEFDAQYGEMEFDGNGAVDLDELLGNLTGLDGSNQNQGYDDEYDNFDVDELLNEDDIDQFIGNARENQDEFDDALPPLEDMLLIINDKSIHAAYNYNPNTGQRGGFTKSNQNSPYAQTSNYGSNNNYSSTEYPPLDQTTWNVDDCDRLVAYLKKQLMAILQYALSVKKLDLRNAPQSETETIFKSSANTLKEVKEVIACIARIDTQDYDHLSIQSSVFGLSDTMVKSTVTMLKTAMSVSRGQSSVNQFTDAYNDFFPNAKNLIGLVNTMNFRQWGPNEIFFA